MNKINPLDDLLVLERKIGLTDKELEEFQKLYNKITYSIKLYELVKETEHDLVTSDDMMTFHENWKDHEVSQLLADMIKKSKNSGNKTYITNKQKDTQK